MEKLLESIPPSVMSFVGMGVMLAVLIMLGTFLQEFAKKLIRTKKGHDRRVNDEWFERFVAATKEYSDSNRAVAEALLDFGSSVGAMSRAIDKRANQALGQHDVIIAKIDELEVPRKQRRYGP